MTGPGEERTAVVPEVPTRTIAVASALAVGAALAAAVLRPTPARPVFSHGPAPAAPERDPADAVAKEAGVLLGVVAGLRSDDSAVRRETAGGVERLARDPDPGRRLALAAALRLLGGREAVLPLCLLVGDEDPSVRVVARRALHAEGQR